MYIVVRSPVITIATALEIVYGYKLLSMVNLINCLFALKDSLGIVQHYCTCILYCLRGQI